MIRETTFLLPALRQSCGPGGCGEPTVREIAAAEEAREERFALRTGRIGRPVERDETATPLIDLVAEAGEAGALDGPRISLREGARRLTAAAELLDQPPGADALGLNPPAARPADIDSPFERASVNEAYRLAEGLDASYLHRGSVYDLRI